MILTFTSTSASVGCALGIELSRTTNKATIWELWFCLSARWLLNGHLETAFTVCPVLRKGWDGFHLETAFTACPVLSLGKAEMVSKWQVAAVSSLCLLPNLNPWKQNFFLWTPSNCLPKSSVDPLKVEKIRVPCLRPLFLATSPAKLFIPIQTLPRNWMSFLPWLFAFSY
jgi:hypothetical protein